MATAQGHTPQKDCFGTVAQLRVDKPGGARDSVQCGLYLGERARGGGLAPGPAKTGRSGGTGPQDELRPPPELPAEMGPHESDAFGGARVGRRGRAGPAVLAPMTTAPVTAAPVTAAPVTAAPVTAAPVTAAPVTAAPDAGAPVTGSSRLPAGRPGGRPTLATVQPR